MNVGPIRTVENHDWARSEILSYFDDVPEKGN